MHSSYWRVVCVVLVACLVFAACVSGGETATDPASPTELPVETPTAVEPVEAPSAEPTPAVPLGDPDLEAPNIVVFMTDDMAMNHMAAMSLTQELIGDRGVSFDRSFVNYPTCCPSRATFLTGQHALNHGVLWNVPPTGGFSTFTNQDTTLPAALQSAGYATYFMGKYLNGYGFTEPTQVTPPGWSSFHGLMEPTAVMYEGFSIYHRGEVTDYSLAAEDYVTDVLTDLAVRGIDTQSGAGGPFMMWVSYPAPHPTSGITRFLFEQEGMSALRSAMREGEKAPIPAQRHRGLAANVEMPITESFNEEDITDKPRPLTRKPLEPEVLVEIEERYRSELESLYSVDESIATIVEELEARGELDNTYLIFTSDNGMFHGQHRYAFGKYFPYEPASRVPLIVAGPNVRTGRSTMLASNVDLAPTIADMAGIELFRPPDGKSLMPVLTDQFHSWERAVLIEGHGPITELRPQFYAVRSDDWYYGEWSSGHRELYDMVADPEQLENIEADTAYAEVVQQHQEWLSELRTCAGPECAEVGNAQLAEESGSGEDAGDGGGEG